MTAGFYCKTRPSRNHSKPTPLVIERSGALESVIETWPGALTMNIRRALKFAALNILVVATIIAAGVFVFGDAPAIQFGVIAAILIAFANYSLVILPRAMDKSKTDAARQRTWKEYGATVFSGATWIYLVAMEGRFGLIVAGVTCAMAIIVGGAIWIGNKAGEQSK